MELNLELTRQTKILLGVLVIVLIATVATQWGPGLYGLISNTDMENKRQNLQTSKDLVAASKILKPVETGLYEKAGLAGEEQAKTIFDGSYSGTVIREKIHAIVKESGIPDNYQFDVDPVPGRKSEKISTHARRNLVVYLYQKKLETERDTLNAEIEAALQAELQAQTEAEIETEEAAMDMLMDAWLNETEADVETPEESEESDEDQQVAEKSDENPIDEKLDEDEDEDHQVAEKPDEDQVVEKPDADTLKPTVEEDAKTPQEAYKNQTDAENPMDTESQWEFASLPASIPSSIQVELIELIISMTEQYLVGAEIKLFEKEFYSTQTEATSGFFGIGAKKPVTEISFRPNSQIAANFTELIDYYEEELDKEKLNAELLEYLETVESQIIELSRKLQMAPTSYLPESYTVKMKFKAEIDKLVNLNRLIETKTKWLMVRDLQISADNKDNKINVDILMIARVYQ